MVVVDVGASAAVSPSLLLLLLLIFLYYTFHFFYNVPHLYSFLSTSFFIFLLLCYFSYFTIQIIRLLFYLSYEIADVIIVIFTLCFSFSQLILPTCINICNRESHNHIHLLLHYSTF